MTVPTSCCGCTAQPPAGADTGRRKVIGMAVAGCVSPQAVWADAPKLAADDRLVEEDAEGAPAPLRVADLKPGKPMMAWPFDAKAGKARDDSRLNKVMLLRLPEDLAKTMDAETRARSAGGVIAFSAVCTHASCDVKTWVAKEQALVCFCHSSKFLLLDGAKVASGPAPRALPALPLKLVGELLVVAGPFSTAPGSTT